MMEEDKKKKKNKKKKSKQATKPTESVTLDAKDSASDNQNPVVETGRDTNENGQFSGGDLYNVDRNTDRHEDLASGSEGAMLEEKIKQLMNENHEYIQKEADKKELIKQLRDEKFFFMQKETTVIKKIVQLEKEKEALIQKEDTLEKCITELQRENDARLQKVAGLEMNILQLEGTKDSWLQKEAGFEEKINHLVDEAAVLNLKVVSLEEKLKQMERERDTWILSESSSKEMIAAQNNENIKLRAQVIELEHSSKSLLEEKQLLEENISSLQLQIKNLESTVSFPHSSMATKVTSEGGDLNQIGASNALGGELMTKKSEVIEKVNELYVKPDRRDVRTEDSVSEAIDVIPVSDSTQSLEEIMIEDQMNDKDTSELLPNSSSEIIEIADEIVQIPLDETTKVNETNNIKVASQNDDMNEVVSLTDAPLIGAPFRLISFFARYVSGADLVK